MISSDVDADFNVINQSFLHPSANKLIRHTSVETAVCRKINLLPNSHKAPLKQLSCVGHFNAKMTAERKIINASHTNEEHTKNEVDFHVSNMVACDRCVN